MSPSAHWALGQIHSSIVQSHKLAKNDGENAIKEWARLYFETIRYETSGPGGTKGGLAVDQGE